MKDMSTKWATENSAARRMIMNKSQISFGLLGVGNMGQNHLRVLSILNSVSLKFIYDTDHEQAARLSEKFDVKVSTDLETDLQSVDAVVICTPTVTHADYIKMAGKHVKNIFVEKPLTHSLQSTKDIQLYAEENGLKIQVGFIERFNPVVMALKNITDIHNNVINIDFTRTNKLSSRISDVDVISDLMIHDLDLALFLNGGIDTVTAYGIIEDNMIVLASAVLRHKKGCFSRILASRITEKNIRLIQATFKDMFVDCHLLRKEVLINKQSTLRRNDITDTYVVTSTEQAVEVKKQEALLTELQSFVAQCSGENISVPGSVDALNAIRLCEKIREIILDQEIKLR
jgi:predicted dehydrogenase